MSQPTSFDKTLLAPRYWLTWLGIGILWLLAHLPWLIQRPLGTGIGWLVYRLAKPRVDDTRINLQLCFPEKSAQERERMVREVFHNAGLGVFETLNGWFRHVDFYRDKTIFEGVEHFKKAEAEGRGILLVGGHFTTLDLMGTLAAQHINVDMIYRPQKNPVINYLMIRRRESHQGRMISHHDTRGLLHALKNSHGVWYPLDQDYGRQQAIFVPFFGVTAATLTTASRLTKFHGARLIFIGVQRLGDAQRYRVIFTPALENFPSDDVVADTTRINLELEKLIRLAPTQYMWFHRRFKTQADGLPEPYAMKKKWKKRLQSLKSSQP